MPIAEGCVIASKLFAAKELFEVVRVLPDGDTFLMAQLCAALDYGFRRPSWRSWEDMSDPENGYVVVGRTEC